MRSKMRLFFALAFLPPLLGLSCLGSIQSTKKPLKFQSEEWLPFTASLEGVVEWFGQYIDPKLIKPLFKSKGVNGEKLAELSPQGLQVYCDAICATLELEHQAQLQTAFSEFGRLSRDPFFMECTRVDQNKQWLDFQYKPPILTRSIFVRKCYDELLTAVLKNDDENRNSVVTGTPGIGKSHFLYVAFWRLVRNGQRTILFVSKNKIIYFDGKVMLRYRGKEDLPSDENFWVQDLWCLVDAMDPLSFEICIASSSILLVTSPRNDVTKDFMKLMPMPRTFYMPLWDKEELRIIQQRSYKECDDWEERLKFLGGVPRVIFGSKVKPINLLKFACRHCSLDDCIKLVAPDEMLTSNENVKQTLIHIHPSSPDSYMKGECRFASEKALRMVCRSKLKNERNVVQRLLQAARGCPIAASMIGLIFEPYAIRKLQCGGEFQFRKLQSRATAVDRVTVPVSPLRREVVDTVDATQTIGQLYVPRSKTHFALDAWIPGFGGFQMTVSTEHLIKPGAKELLGKLGKKGNRLIFVLPPEQFRTMKRKKPYDIEQFGLMMPYPEVMREGDQVYSDIGESDEENTAESNAEEDDILMEEGSPAEINDEGGG